MEVAKTCAVAQTKQLCSNSPKGPRFLGSSQSLQPMLVEEVEVEDDTPDLSRASEKTTVHA